MVSFETGFFVSRETFCALVDESGFNGEIYIWGVAPNPTQETFWKKFLVNLQKLFNIGVYFSFLFIFQSLTVSSFEVLYGAHHATHAFTEKHHPQPPFVACAIAVAGSNARRCGVLTARHCENFI